MTRPTALPLPLWTRLLVPSAMLLATLVPAVLHAAPAQASEEACADGSGVIVVVDFSDIGGEVVTSCAPTDPATGREALEAAGFTPTDSLAGFICAIDAAPNPCPEAFDGSFWAYWHSTADGEWTSHAVGADSSDPAPGEIEGWRYNDGSVPPGIAPADAAAALTSATDGPDTDGSEAEDSNAGEENAEAATQSTGNTATYVAIGLAVLTVIAIVILLVRAQNRRRAGNR